MYVCNQMLCILMPCVVLLYIFQLSYAYVRKVTYSLNHSDLATPLLCPSCGTHSPNLQCLRVDKVQSAEDFCSYSNENLRELDLHRCLILPPPTIATQFPSLRRLLAGFHFHHYPYSPLTYIHTYTSGYPSPQPIG